MAIAVAFNILRIVGVREARNPQGVPHTRIERIETLRISHSICYS